jgi:hypothetical protein
MDRRHTNAYFRYLIEKFLIYDLLILYFKATFDGKGDVTDYIFCKIESLKVHSESNKSTDEGG